MRWLILGCSVTVVLSTVPGCSFLYDGEEYLGSGSDGGLGTDGGGDGSVDPNAPTAPTVAVSPDGPTTLDDVEVTITVASSDPMGEEVTYEYEWLRDGSATGLTGPTISAEETAKGETWTVRVTPVAGSRRGAPGEDSVEVVNSPPTIRTLGLSTYRPRSDERVRAFPAHVVDADGDTTTFRYAWRKSGTGVAVATDTIDLKVEGFSESDTLEIEVVANDGEEDGPPIGLGPIAVGPAATAWRQLLPNRVSDSEEFAFFIHDANNTRAVLYVEGTLWEYALEDGRQRWVQLWPEGTGPDLFGAAVFYDRARSRALVIGGTDTATHTINTAVWALDLTRGQEAWSELVVGGDSPGPRFWPAVLVDEARSRALLYGTVPFEGEIPASDELWQLDLTEGSEAWSLVDVGTVSPGPIVGASWMLDHEHDTAYLVGGFLWDDDTGGPVGGGDQVWALDLTPGAESFAELSERLPMELAFATTTFDPVRRRGLLVHGATTLEIDAVADQVLTFDPETTAWSVLSTAAASVPGTFLESLTHDESADRFVLLGGLMAGERFSSVVTMDPAGTFTAWDVPWVTGPGAVSHAGLVQETDHFIVLGGRDHDSHARAEAFRYVFARNEFVPAEVMPDAVDGTPPATWGWGQYGGTDADRGIFVGGWSHLGGHDPAQAWELKRVSGGRHQWLLHTVPAGAQPSAREGAFLAQGTCTASEVTMFGGYNQDTAAYEGGPTWALHGCNTAGKSCQWNEIATVAVPSGRAFASSSRTDSGDHLMYGGVGASGDAIDDLWLLDGCAVGTDIWTNVTPATRPPPRYGHTMTYDRGLSGLPPRQYVFGGRSTGGGVSHQDVWILTESPWTFTELTPLVDADHPRPRGRYHHVAAWDRARARLLVFGGWVGYDASNELWELRVVE